MKKYRIAYIPGDGIGKETGPEGVRVLEAAARKFGFELKFDEYDWSCDYYAKHGRMMPEDGLEQVRQHDAVFFGAAGWPATVPDHISLWGLLIPFRRNFQQYVNLRPVRLMPGVKCPLADRKPGDIDFWVVRENSEGEYSSIGGRMYSGTDDEFATQQAIFSRRGTDRIMRFAFELAKKGKKNGEGRGKGVASIVQQFLKVFLDIVLWRRGPQDLPSSGLLVVITLVAYELVNLVQIALVDVSVSELLLYLVVDPLLLMGGLWLVMTLFGRKERWSQTISAVLGCSALMGLVVSVPMVLLFGPRMASNPPAAVQLLALGLVIAFILVVGRIIQLATESNLLTGSAIATTYVVILHALAGMLRSSGS